MLQVRVAITQLEAPYDSQVGDKTWCSSVLTSEVNELSKMVIRFKDCLRTSRVKEKMATAKVNALDGYRQRVQGHS